MRVGLCIVAHLAGGVLLLDGLDDTDGHGLAHVTHGKAAQRRVGGEGLHAHGLGGHLSSTWTHILDTTCGTLARTNSAHGPKKANTRRGGGIAGI